MQERGAGRALARPYLPAAGARLLPRDDIRESISSDRLAQAVPRARTPTIDTIKCDRWTSATEGESCLYLSASAGRSSRVELPRQHSPLSLRRWHTETRPRRCHASVETTVTRRQLPYRSPTSRPRGVQMLWSSRAPTSTPTRSREVPSRRRLTRRSSSPRRTVYQQRPRRRSRESSPMGALCISSVAHQQRSEERRVGYEG